MKASDIELGKTYTIKRHARPIYPAQANSLNYPVPITGETASDGRPWRSHNMTRPKCELCGGMLAFLGQLGLLRWFRCINCGMEFSRRGKRQ